MTTEEKRAKARAKYREAYDANPEAFRKRSREQYAKNKAKGKFWSRRWRAKNRERYLANCMRYSNRWMAKNRGQMHPQSDVVKEQELFELARRLTKETGLAHVVDHIIPIGIGGWHHHDNLQVLPSSANSRKHCDPFWEDPKFKSWRDVPKELWPIKMKPAYEALMQGAK